MRATALWRGSAAAARGRVICLDAARGNAVAQNISAGLGGVIGPIALFTGTDGRLENSSSKMFALRRTRATVANAVFGVPMSDIIADSHMRAWEDFLADETARGEEWCAFFEDDAFVASASFETSAQLAVRVRTAIDEAQKARAHVLFLGYIGGPIFEFLHALIGHSNREREPGSGLVTFVPRVAVGSHGYMLSRSGMEIALRAAKKRGLSLFYSTDFFLQDLAARGELRFRALRSRAVFQTSTAPPGIKVSGVGSDILAGKKSSTAGQFPRFVAALVGENTEVDDCVSARYLFSYELARLFRIPALAISLTTVFLVVATLVVAGIAGVAASVAHPLAGVAICAAGAIAILALLVPDFVAVAKREAPLRTLGQCAFHFGLCAGTLGALATAICVAAINRGIIRMRR